MIKTFRGLLNDGAQERIRLQTLDGKTGYRIKKFQVMPFATGTGTNEAMVSVFKISQDTAPQDVDFGDVTLLGAAFFLRDQGVVAITSETIIFDGEIFNQDIFVNYADAQGASGRMNYYLELEQISLDDAEATAAILKNFRNTNTVA